MTPKKDYVLYARSVKWLFWHSIQLGKGRALPINHGINHYGINHFVCNEETDVVLDICLKTIKCKKCATCDTQRENDEISEI